MADSKQTDPQQAQHAAASGQSEKIGHVPPIGGDRPADANSPAPRRRFVPNRRLLTVAGILVAGLGLAGGAFAALATINSPAKQLGEALARLDSVQSLQY